MIINKLVIENIGLLYGRNVFNMRPRIKYKNSRPIVIFGGKNGAGKTTIFEMIRLCLYGREIFQSISQEKYLGYLREKIHQSKTLSVQPDYAAVEMEFEYAKTGEKSLFYITRSWEIENKKVIETLSIKKNGDDLEDIEKDNWQDFIKELIPIGLSRLFFLDGEKIQKIMQLNDEEITNSINSLLGLDLTERLEADLKIYQKKNLEKNENALLTKELEGCKREYSFLSGKIKKINDSIAELQNRIDQEKDKIGIYGNKVAVQGGGFVKGKNRLENEKNMLEKEIELTKENIIEIVAGLLPVSIIGEEAKKLKKQIIKEQEKHKWDIASEQLNKKSSLVIKNIKKSAFWKNISGVKENQINKIKENIEKEIKAVFKPSHEFDNVRIIFGLSQNQAEKLISDIDAGTKDIPEKLKIITRSFEKKLRRLQTIYRNIEKVPEDEFVKPMFEKLGEMNKVLGSLENQKTTYAEDIKSLKVRLNEIDKKINTVEGKLSSINKNQTKVNLLKKTENVLKKYQQSLTSNKVALLQKEFENLFNKLHNKQDLISKIDIDEQTFDIKLQGATGKYIKKSSLSSGESEIYSIAMLWALARISGRNLPFIIDTPLGRLDSKHRENLINHFFPFASHQMIIFSTDTEIDMKYYKQLKDYTSHAYHLEYDKKLCMTISKEGYFGN